MAEDSRITLSLWLKDRLTGPLRKARRAIDDLAAGSRQASAAETNQAAQSVRNTRRIVNAHEQRARAARTASRESVRAFTWEQRQFARRARRMGFFLDQRGRRYNPRTGEYMSRRLERMLRRQAHAALLGAGPAVRFSNAITKMTARMTVGFKSAEAMNRSVYRLTRRYGAGREEAVRYGRAVENAWRRMPQTANRAADRIGAAMGKIYSHHAGIQSTLAKGWTYGVAAPAAGLAGYAAYSGVKRLNAFEGADVRLPILGLPEGQVDEVKKQVDQIVRGTFISLDEGLGLATKVLAANTDYATQFEDRMQTLVDVSSVYAPNDIQGIGLVYNQITNKRFLHGEERNQLAERMVPIDKMLADYLDVEIGDIMPMIEARQITAEMVWEASQIAAEGGAQAMGKTFQGQFKLMQASIGRLGYSVLAGMSQSLGKFFQQITVWADAIAPTLQDIGENLGRGIAGAVERMPELAAALAPLEAPLREFFSAFADALPEIVTGLANFLRILTPLIVAGLEFATVVLRIAEPIMWFLIPALLTFLHVVGFLTQILIVVAVFRTFGKAIWGVVKWLWRLTRLGPMLRAFFTQFRLGRVLAAMGRDIARLGGRIFRYLTAPFVRFGRFLAGLGGRLGRWVGTALGRLGTLVAGWAVRLWRTVGGALGGLWRTLGGGRGILRAFGWALRGAFRFVPIIGWIMLLLDALGLLYDRVEGVRDVFDTVSDAVSNLVDWFDKLLGRADEWMAKKLGIDNPEDSTILRDSAARVIPGSPARGLWDLNIGGATVGERAPGFVQDAKSGWDRLWGINDFWGSGEGLYRIFHGSGSRDEAGGVPAHAAGGWTASGAHLAMVGERGREFVVNSWASRAVEASRPGAMAYINATGALPPSGGGASVTYAPNVELHVGPGTDTAEFTRIVRAELARQARQMNRQYATPGLRGAH